MDSVKVIVALGATAAQTLLGSALREGGITEHRGKVIWSSLVSRWVVISVHPAYALRRVSEEWTLAQDLMLARQVARTGQPPGSSTARYTLVRTLDQVRQMRDAILAAQFRLFWDVETDGLHSKYARAFCFSCCIDRQDSAWVLEFSGEGTVSALLEGSISPEVMVTPAGLARISAVKVHGIVGRAA